MRAKSVAAPFFALLLVTSAIIAAPTGYIGTASAAHDCQFSDSLTFSILNSFDQDATGQDCTLLHGDTTAESGIDKVETMESIVSSGAGANDHARTYLTATENNLQTSETIARQEALAAYYRALENGSTKSQAKIAAEDAIRAYYSTIQQNVVESWNTAMLNWVDYDNLETSEGIDATFVGAYNPGSTPSQDQYGRYGLSINGQISAQTVNGTETTVEILYINDDGNPSGDRQIGVHNTSTSNAEVFGFQAGYYNDTVSTATSPQMERWGTLWTDAENKSQQVIDGIGTYINNTYDAYQQGTLNATEIAGPNALSQEFAAEGDFQNWAVLRLSQMEGADPPENLSQTGSFRVDVGLNTYEGILLSGGNPDSGSFEAGETYDSANITGSQYIVTSDATHELTGEWALESITNDEGEQVNSSTINEVDYSVANTSDYKELLEDMDNLRAELNAREEATAGGGGLLGSTFGTAGQIAAVAVVAGGALLVYSGGLGGSGGGGSTINVSDRVRARRERKRED